MKVFIKNNIIYIYILLFFIISYVSIYSTSYFNGSNLQYKQLIWYLLGILTIILIQKIDIKKIYKSSVFLYIINILLLFGLLFFGEEINNSKSWYRIANISIQPNEFMKPILILLNASFINNFYKKNKKVTAIKEFKLILSLLLITLLPCILAYLEPDTGSIISYLIITISMLYISGINKKWFYSLFSILAIVIIVILSTYFINKKLLIDLLGPKFSYRIERIIDWQNQKGMQLNNSLIAIGSSGLTGHQKIPIYYPESATDFIFTSFSSSYGLIGSIFLIVILLSFDVYLLNSIKIANTKEKKYTIFGIFILFFYQQIQCISMTIGITPINGITFPLISYGGSSLISYMFLLGIIIKINKKRS